MSVYSTRTTPEWVSKRILDFFNSVQSIYEITDGPIQDDPSDGAGRKIGPALAQRILDTRRQLPFQQFTDLYQLLSIPGLGPNTFQDIRFSFGKTAAQYFKELLFDKQVLAQEKWELNYFEHRESDPQIFDAMVFDENRFREAVVQLMIKACQDRGLPADACRPVIEQMRQATIEQIPHIVDRPSRQLAQWFDRIDNRKSFSYNQILNACFSYFYYHPPYSWDMGLRFVKGVTAPIFRPEAIQEPDLPVVVNFREWTITLWMVAFYK